MSDGRGVGIGTLGLGTGMEGGGTGIGGGFEWVD